MDINDYFKLLNKRVARAYKVAEKARRLGKDPELKVDISVAKNKAERCVSLVAIVAPEILDKGIPEEIIKLEGKYEAGDFRVALTIAYRTAKEEFCSFESRTKALATGIRLGLAYATLGTVSAPLEGFIELKIKKTGDGKDYLAVYYAGPIRAAGGTAEAVSVLIADYLRHKFGYAKYDVKFREVERYLYEVSDYNSRVSRLQYFPTKQELEFLVTHIGVEVSGDPTTTFEVSNCKDLERVETNQIRGGMCLVLCEGVAQKAGKVYKKLESWGDNFDFTGWSWVKDFLKVQKRIWNKRDKGLAGTESKLSPNFKFIQDAVAGRPILSYPLTRGGFRLRYGRTRFTGHECLGFNPATMRICNNFLATGTQLKIELPGKGCTVTPCEFIDGPVVELIDGTVLKLNTFEEADKVINEVKRIIYLGDILVNYGAFKEHGHKLIPSPYVPEWWVLDFKKAVSKGFKSHNKERINELINNPFTVIPDLDESVKISKEFKIPLHPSHSFFYDQKKEYLLDVAKNLSIKMPKSFKKQLSLLGVPHKVSGNSLVIAELDYKRLKLVLDNYRAKTNDVFKELSGNSGLKIMNTAPFFIGARMGRPEKAKLRVLKGKPHMMFPVGRQGGRYRSFNAAYNIGYVEGDFPLRVCPKCSNKTVLSFCEECGSPANKYYKCYRCGKEVSMPVHCNTKCASYSKRRIDIKHYIDKALKSLSIQMPPLVKGVRGTSNKTHVPESLEKGILRAKHGIYVNKDATIRLDFTELSLTHFKPKEIGVSIERLIELGYTTDIHGNELKGDDQVLEIIPQDVIISECSEFPGADMTVHLINIANFVDELLVKFYHLKPYYSVKSKSDLIGKLIVCLAPHTSAGVIGRIIGFSKIQALIAHPYLHAGCRRDADGDELGIILLMDALLNFSRQYLPDKRGGRTMDAPLVLTTNLNPLEVDDEVYDFDRSWVYPLSFYKATLKYKDPWSIKSIKRVEDFLGKPEQYYGFGFTHPVEDINHGVHVTSYKTLVTMMDKLYAQMDLAKKLCAVDAKDVASLVINKHFLRDIKGNLRKFTSQTFRCVDCNAKYRRIPLIGRCTSCNGKLLLTVHHGTVVKYLEPSINLAETYNVDSYIKQTLEILKQRVEGLFGWDTFKQTDLNNYLKK